MGKILDEIFYRCNDINYEFDSLTNEELRKVKTKINTEITVFKNSIEHDDFREKFIDFCNTLDELYAEKEIVYSNLLIKHGMAFQTKLFLETLT